MADYSDRKTEAELRSLERKLNRLYKRAWNEMRLDTEEYFEQFSERYQREYEKYKKGAYTEAQFKAWYQAQVARGKTWEARRDSLAMQMTHTNEIAAAYINNTTPSIYALNSNYAAYMTEQKYDVSFTLVNQDVVKNLVTEKSNAIEFKTLAVNPTRDYKWNAKQIQSALVSGILTGKSIGELADSFMVVQKRNRNAAIRNARTSVTSAQNAGRIDTMKRSRDMGIEVKKQWLSAHDDRVRDSHAALNGQIRDIDEPFDNGLQYPADPEGIPSEVYNCRCTLKYVYPKYQDIASRELYTTTREDGESYQDWLKRKKGANDRYSLSVAPRSVRQQKKMATAIDKDISRELGTTSYWANKIKRGKQNTALPNGIIELEADAPNKTIAHEITHMHSYVKHGFESYRQNKYIEEATVELYAREYSKRKGFEVAQNLEEDIYLLTTINREYKLYPTDYDFAKELVNVDLPDRYDWLFRKVADGEASEEAKDFVLSRFDRILRNGEFYGNYELFGD